MHLECSAQIETAIDSYQELSSKLQGCLSEVKSTLRRYLYVIGIVAIVVGVVQVCNLVSN